MKPWATVQTTTMVRDPSADQVVSWTSPRPLPRRVGFRELTRLVKDG